MYQRYSTLLLQWLKVPPEPHAPAGDPASVRVFRAGKNYFKLRLLGWAIPQALALAGLIFWTTVLLQVEEAVRAGKQPGETSAAVAPGFSNQNIKTAASAPVSPAEKTARKKARPRGWSEFKQSLVVIGGQLPPWVFPLLWAVKIIGLGLYLVQIPFTYALRRLDYEMRWYVVTDRSLRIRAGIWRVQELTMSFANLQQVEVSQGPVQGLLGLADVRVQSAGGGASVRGQKYQRDSLHTAMFHSVDNATEIRDLILERLRRFRATGLGDHDDRHDHRVDGRATGADFHGGDAAIEAARELLAEARALRNTLAR